MKVVLSLAITSGFAVAYRGCSGGGYGGSGCYCSSVKIVAKKKKTPKRSSPKDSQKPPPRITSNVKQNLQFLRLSKEFQKGKSVAAKPATRYRRKKVEKEEIPNDDAEPYRDPTFSLYYTSQGSETGVPVLLVDGYNMCGYWPKLKKHFMSGELDVARRKLIDELVTFRVLRKVKIVAVFDAMMSNLPTHKETIQGIDIVFSSKTSADAWIEKEVVALRNDGCPEVWVVTSDRCEQDAVHGAGAYVWSCKTMVSEIEASHEEVDSLLREQRSTSVSLLKNGLDAKVVVALKDLRDQLLKMESKR